MPRYLLCSSYLPPMSNLTPGSSLGMLSLCLLYIFSFPPGSDPSFWSSRAPFFSSSSIPLGHAFTLVFQRRSFYALPFSLLLRFNAQTVRIISTFSTLRTSFPLSHSTSSQTPRQIAFLLLFLPNHPPVSLPLLDSASYFLSILISTSPSAYPLFPLPLQTTSYYLPLLHSQV